MNYNKTFNYSCSEDYIEVPGGTESVTWTDDEGTTYEVDVGDLINADTDNEIQITKGKTTIPYLTLSKKKKKVPYMYCRYPSILSQFQKVR